MDNTNKCIITQEKGCKKLNGNKKKKCKQKKKRSKCDRITKQESGVSDTNVVDELYSSGTKGIDSDASSQDKVTATIECVSSKTPLPPIVVNNHINLTNTVSAHASESSSVLKNLSSADNVSLFYEETLNKSMCNLSVKKKLNHLHIIPVRRAADSDIQAASKHPSPTPNKSKSRMYLKSGGLTSLHKTDSSVNNSSRNQQKYQDDKVSEMLIESSTLRWDTESEDAEQEMCRLEQYKTERRKRYIEAAKDKGLSWARRLDPNVTNRPCANSLELTMSTISVCKAACAGDSIIDSSCLSTMDLLPLTQPGKTLVYNC